MVGKILEYSDFKDKCFLSAFDIIKQSKNILIWGDEDPDGMTASSIMYNTFVNINKRVDYYIPSREKDGIGLNIKRLKQLMKKNYDTIITVDCGSVNNNEIIFLKNNGINVIITDHHIPYKKRIKNVPYINSHLLKSKKFSNLSGAGIALVFSIFILKKYFNLKSYDQALFFNKRKISLASVGTICDKVEIKGFNKFIDTYKNNFSIDFPEFKKCKNDFSCICGIIYMSKTEKLKNSIVDFFINKINNSRKNIVFNELNKKRKNNLRKIDNYTQLMLKKLNVNNKVILISNNRIHWSFIGIVASRISEKVNKPICIISKKSNYFVGEARANTKFDWIKVFNNFSHYFINWGGHKQAAGFSLKKEMLNAFIDDFNIHFNK